MPENRVGHKLLLIAVIGLAVLAKARSAELSLGKYQCRSDLGDASVSLYLGEEEATGGILQETAKRLLGQAIISHLRFPGACAASRFTWRLSLILLRFPSEGSKLPYDSIQKSCPGPVAGGKAGDSSPGWATLGGCLAFPKEPNPLLVSPR